MALFQHGEARNTRHRPPVSSGPVSGIHFGRDRGNRLLILQVGSLPCRVEHHPVALEHKLVALVVESNHLDVEGPPDIVLFAVSEFDPGLDRNTLLVRSRLERVVGVDLDWLLTDLLRLLHVLVLGDRAVALPQSDLDNPALVVVVGGLDDQGEIDNVPGARVTRTERLSGNISL